MICDKCTSKAELKQFNTFEYWYCTKCKEEVATQAKDQALYSPVQPSKVDAMGSKYYPVIFGYDQTCEYKLMSAAFIKMFVTASRTREMPTPVTVIYRAVNAWLQVATSLENTLGLADVFNGRGTTK